MRFIIQSLRLRNIFNVTKRTRERNPDARRAVDGIVSACPYMVPVQSVSLHEIDADEEGRFV